MGPLVCPCSQTRATILNDFADASIPVTDPTVALGGHVSCRAILTRLLKDGRELASAVEVSRGKWIVQPLTTEKIEAKFGDCARDGGLSPDSIGFYIDFTRSLQSHLSIGALVAAFRRVGSQSPQRPAL
jgi:hypothetical protein